MTISKKNNPFKSLIKYIRKTRREAYWNLQIPKWYVALILSAILCFVSSYVLHTHCKCCEWLSSFLLSIGAGIITGLVVFILGNIREQIKTDVEIKIEQLSNLYDVLEQVYNTVPDKITHKLSGKTYNYAYCAYKTIKAAQEYIEEIKKLDYKIFNKFIKETAIDVNMLELNIAALDAKEISEDLGYLGAVQIQSEVISIIQEAAEWFEENLREAEMQKQQICKYPL